MKRFRHLRVSAAVAVAVATLIPLLAANTASATDSGLERRFEADLTGDIATVGAPLAACAVEKCPPSSTARLDLPSDSSIVHARLLWAAGLDDDCVAAQPVPIRPRLSLRTDSGTAEIPVAGAATGEHTAEADVTEALAKLSGPATVTVAGVRADGCAAGWSLATAYEHPDAGRHHVVIDSGATADTRVTVTGFHRFGDAAARLDTTVYGESNATEVNGVRLESAGKTHVTTTEVPAAALAEGDTTAAIDVTGRDPLVQQVALSVPVRALTVGITATPKRIGPGSTVSYTVTVTNDGVEAVTGAEVRVDLSRAIDDASRPVAIAATTGRARYGDDALTWTGDVAANETVTIDYAMTVRNPRPGDGRMAVSVAGGADSNCGERDRSADCELTLRFPPQPNVQPDQSGGSATTAGRLPVTGSPTGPLAALAAGIALLGAVLRFAPRRSK